MTLEAIIQAGRLVLQGQVRRYFSDLIVENFDIDTLAACMARGTPAKIAAQRLRQEAIQSSPSIPEFADVPDIDSVAGYGDALFWAKDLVADIADYRAGQLAWREIESGAVMYGPPGTGKSSFAGVIAKAAEVQLMTTSIAELFTTSSGHLDSVLKSLRAVFDEANSRAPCLLFLDEIDGLPRRGAGGHNENYWRPVINDLLMLLDSSLRKREGVVILAATNRLQDVDPALLRSQRLERLLYVGPPSAIDLAQILRSYLKDELPNADLVSLVAARPFATGADAKSWARDARRRARRAQRAMVYDDIVVEVIGVEGRSPEVLRRVAVHEAGRVVAAYALGVPIDVVSLAADSSSAGYTLFSKRKKDMSTRSQEEIEVIVMLGGRAAEHATYGSDHSTFAGGSWDSDLGQATQRVTDWHVHFGLMEGLVYRPEGQVALEHDSSLRQLVKGELERLYGYAKGIMVTHYEALQQLTEHLLRRRTLTQGDVHSILSPEWQKPSGEDQI